MSSRCTTWHGDGIPRPPHRGAKWHEAALCRARDSDAALIVTSKFVAADLRADGVSGDRITMVHGGSDHLVPDDREQTEALLRRLGVRHEFLLSVSTLEPRKNVDRLLRAYGQILPTLPEPWPLVIVGPTGWGPSLSGPQEQRGVVFAGAVSDAVLTGLYRRARAFAYVPLTEGYGLPPLEAMRSGTPSVIANEVPSVVDLEESGPPPARIVDPFDVDDIAAGLTAVLTDDVLRADLSVRGEAHSLAHVEGGGTRAHRALEGTGMSTRLALSLDVSAVPVRPGGAGYYTMAIADGLRDRDDVALTMVARRGDEERWRRPGAGPAQVVGVVPGSRPARLAFEQLRFPRLLDELGVEVHHAPHYTMPARAPVPCVVTIHDCTFFDHPEWHMRSKALFFRRAIRYTGSARGGARLRERGHGNPSAAPAARCAHRSSWHPMESTTRASHLSSRHREPIERCSQRTECLPTGRWWPSWGRWSPARAWRR